MNFTPVDEISEALSKNSWSSPAIGRVAWLWSQARVMVGLSTISYGAGVKCMSARLTLRCEIGANPWGQQ